MYRLKMQFFIFILFWVCLCERVGFCAKEIDFSDPNATVYVIDSNSSELKCLPIQLNQLPIFQEPKGAKPSYLSQTVSYLSFFNKHKAACVPIESKTGEEEILEKIVETTLNDYQWIDRKDVFEHYLKTLETESNSKKDKEDKSSLKKIYKQTKEIVSVLKNKNIGSQFVMGASLAAGKMVDKSLSSSKKSDQIQLTDLIPEDSYKMHFLRLFKGTSALLLTFVAPALINSKDPTNTYILGGLGLALLIGQDMANSAWGSSVDRKSLKKAPPKYESYFKFLGKNLNKVKPFVNYTKSVIPSIDFFPSYLSSGMEYLPFVGKMFKLYDASQDIISGVSGYESGYDKLKSVENVNWMAFQNEIALKRKKLLDTLQQLQTSGRQSKHMVSMISRICEALLHLAEIEKRGNSRFEMRIKYLAEKLGAENNLGNFVSKFPFFSEPGTFKDKISQTEKEDYYSSLKQSIATFSKYLNDALNEAGETLGVSASDIDQHTIPAINDSPKATDAKIENAEKTFHTLVSDLKEVRGLTYEMSQQIIEQIQKNEPDRNFTLELKQPGFSGPQENQSDAKQDWR